MRTHSSPPKTPAIHYAAPLNREDALNEGDWERAYTLACREEVVQYLAAPAPRNSSRKRKRPASS